MCKDIKYPEERKQEEFDRLLRQMAKDRKFVERLLDQLIDCAMAFDPLMVDEIIEEERREL